jgi:crossover junction endodeoxyribonuclease RusA
MIVSAEAKAYKESVGWIAKASGLKLTQENVHLSVQYHPKLTVKNAASKTRLDLDNLIKVLADALNGVAYEDDKQIVKISAELSYPIQDGGLTVQVTEVML